MIQIFGTKKCQDTRKAQRFYKERGIKFQFTDINEKGFSKGELSSVIGAVGFDNILDSDTKDKQALSLVLHVTDAARLDTLLDNQHIIKTPVVRSGKKCAVGYSPEKWKSFCE